MENPINKIKKFMTVPPEEGRKEAIITIGTGLAALALSPILTACGDESSIVSHPTPSSAEIPWPQDAVLLYDQPENRIKAGKIELYQNTPKDFPEDPFEAWVSPIAFQTYASSLEAEGVVKEDNIKFVYHFPGKTIGSELICQENGKSIVTLEMARAVYEHVYQAHFLGQDLENPEISKKFLAETQNQYNLVLWHESQHIMHCREKLDKDMAEKDAIEAETRRAIELQPVFYLKLKQNANLNKAIEYIEKLRTLNNK